MKKIFTLMTLLVAIVTGAWADGAVVYKSNFTNGQIIQLSQTYVNTSSTGESAWITKATSAGGAVTASSPETMSAVSVWRVKQWSSRYLEFWVTGVSKITFYANHPGLKDGKAKDSRIMKATVNQTSETSPITLVDIEKDATVTQGSGDVTLNPAINNKVRVYATGDMDLYAMVVTIPAATAAPTTPSFTPNGGSVDGGSTTTIASSNAQKIYYCWTDNSTAPAQDAEDTWTEASGDSKVFTIPNVTATNMYLHAYGWNNFGGSSYSATNTSNAFNVTKISTPAKSYNFSGAFTDEMKAALVADKFEWDGSALRYKSKAKIDKDTDNDLGTYSGITAWNGLIFGRTGSDINAGYLRIQENGYIQINGGNGYYKLEGLYDGDIVRVRCASSNADITNTRKFTVTGATVGEISVKGSDAGYYEFELTKSGNGDFSIKQDNGINLWVISVNQTLPAVPEVAVSTTTGNTYATYVTSYALDFTGVEGITAYIVTEDAGSSVTTEAVGKVPANTAILVKTASAGSSVNVPRASGATALSDNKLHYSSTNMTVTADQATAKQYYGFFKVGEEYGFAPLAAGTLAANKAYLDYGTEGNSLQFIKLDLGEVTAVQNVEAAPEANKAQVGKKAFVNGQLVIMTENGFVNALGQTVK